MNLLQLKNGSKSFGSRVIFDGASFSVDSEEKIGVIGPNGAGKTTLFRILAESEELAGGEITRANGLRVGYLAQEEEKNLSQTVEEFLSSQTETPIWELKSFAPRFGLKLAIFPRLLAELSGGYRMRARLLRLMATRPDLLLLDEPTNYLDLETLVVLESFLQDYKGSYMLISHDREFLRRTTDHILEVEEGQITKFAGNIDDYFEQKQMLREQLEQTAASQDAKRKVVLAFAARFGAKATKAKQVQSRLRQMEKMEGIEISKIPVKAKIRLPEPSPSSKVAVTLRDCDLGYAGVRILGPLALELKRGDHLGVVGINGAGKSTLLKALANELKPLNGRIEYGERTEVSYFAQHVAERLNPEHTVFEAMSAFASRDTKRQEISDLAGSLLFSGDAINKKVRILSGGEKSRVALGQILLKRSSMLLLDEPTNHLDFDTVEALTQSLATFAGTVVVVSHDRGFVRRVSSKILEIRSGRAEFYPGTYDEYVWSVQKGALANRDQSLSGTSSGHELVREEKTTVSEKFNYKEKRKQLEKEIRGLEKEMQKLDRDMEQGKTAILQFNESLLTSTGRDAADVAKKIAAEQQAIERAEGLYLGCLERHQGLQQELEAMLRADAGD